MVVVAVNKKFTSDKMDAKGLTSYLGNESKTAAQSSPKAADLMKMMASGGEKNGLWAKPSGLFKS
jgi:hypothetical protein